jgi:predicted Ser/Thr protein kinase
MDTTSPSPDPLHGLDPQSLMAAAAMPTDGGADTIPLTARDLPSLEEIATAFPDLEILDLIGHGGMSAVFRAKQPKLDRVIALKVLPKSLAATPGFAERFTREGRVLARLSHPNIVAVHDFGESGGFCYLIMEYVDGVNLRQAMRAGRFTPEQALNIIPAICDALQFAHTQGVLHRDIKPENILLDSKGKVKIADFGIAKIISEDAGDATLLTQSGAKLGTAPYMAPEQIEKPSSVDHRADIYSLGVVFYEMLTGELPLGRFAAPSEFAAVGGNIDEIVFRALEKERGRRQQSAGEFKTQIECLGTGQRPPQASKRPQNIEYKSKRTLCGMPLLHVALGRDPATGKRRHARGFFAFGDLATGVFAFGGIARGLFACGGIAVGGIAFGGMGLGLISFGGLAIALLLGIGGVAVGPLAMGGVALGWYSVGGVAVGMSAYGGVASGPQAMGGVVGAKQVVTKLAEMPPVIQRMVAAGPWLSALSLLWLPLSWMMLLVPWWARRQIEANRGGQGEGTSRSSLRVFWTIPALTAGCALLWWLIWRWTMIGTGGVQAFIIPTVVSCLGLLFFGLGLPLWLRLVPMNSFYGVRLPSTFQSDQRWFAVNAVFGKHLFWWSLLVMGAGIAGFYQLPRHQDAYPWAAITLTLVAVAASVAATLWWMRQHPAGAPERKKIRLVSWSGQAVVAVVIAMFIKSFIAGAYRVPVGSEPGVAKDSHWLALHLDTGFEKGDLILFEHDSGHCWIARVVEREPKGLRLKRGGSPEEFFVPWDKVIGKMLFSHFSPGVSMEEPVVVPRRASISISESTSKALDTLPVLRFSRLKLSQAEWRWPVYAPDGSPIENAISQPLIRDASHTDHEGLGADDCWWQLWFQHPDFDRRSMVHVSITHLDGSEISGRYSGHAGPAFESPDSPACVVISPGIKGSLPKAVRMVLRYSIGPWTNGSKVKSTFNGFMSFKHGELGGIGEGLDKRAFMTWLKKADDWQPDVNARLLDGQWSSRSGASSSTTNGQIIQKFEFEARLNEIEYFQTRTRAIRTLAFDKVIIPPLPDDANAWVNVQLGVGRSSQVKWQPGLTIAQAMAQAVGTDWKTAKVIRLTRDGISTNYNIQLAETTETKPDDQILLPE